MNTKSLYIKRILGASLDQLEGKLSFYSFLKLVIHYILQFRVS